MAGPKTHCGLEASWPSCKPSWKSELLPHANTSPKALKARLHAHSVNKQGGEYVCLSHGITCVHCSLLECCVGPVAKDFVVKRPSEVLNMLSNKPRACCKEALACGALLLQLGQFCCQRKVEAPRANGLCTHQVSVSHSAVGQPGHTNSNLVHRLYPPSQ